MEAEKNFYKDTLDKRGFNEWNQSQIERKHDHSVVYFYEWDWLIPNLDALIKLHLYITLNMQGVH